MKNKKYYIIVMILLLIFITACNSNNLSEKKLDTDMDKVRNTTYEDVVKIVSEDINAFLDQYDHYTISNLAFEEDKLAVDDQDQVKKFNNIKIDLVVEVDSEKFPIKFKEDMTILERNKTFAEFMSNENRKLLYTLAEKNPLEYSKVGNIETSYIDEKNNINYHSNMGNLRNSETMIALSNEESEEENLMLEKIFDHIKKDKDKREFYYEVRRFGIDNNMLILELNLHGQYDEDFTKKLEEMSNQLSELVLDDENFVNYINKQKVESIEIIFNKGEDDTDPAVYQYKVDP